MAIFDNALVALDAPQATSPEVGPEVILQTTDLFQQQFFVGLVSLLTTEGCGLTPGHQRRRTPADAGAQRHAQGESEPAQKVQSERKRGLAHGPTGAVAAPAGFCSMPVRVHTCTEYVLQL